MNKYIIFAVVVIIAGAAFFGLSRYGHVPTPATEPSAAMKTYSNETHHYSLSYPATIEAREYTADDVAFGTISGDAIAAVAEAQVLTIDGAPGQSFANAVEARMQTYCDADGPESSIYCTGVATSTSFTTDSGMPGIEFFLNGELKVLATGSTTQFLKGPYVAFALSTGATGSEALIVRAPLNQSAAEADADAIRAIAKSVTRSEPVR